MPEAEGKVNVYVCPHGHRTVTRNMAEGMTPMMIGCPTCKAAGTPPNELGFRSVMAQSSFYRVDQTLDHSHEWYRPASPEGLDADTAEHVRHGGLLLREREKVEAEAEEWSPPPEIFAWEGGLWSEEEPLTDPSARYVLGSEADRFRRERVALLAAVEEAEVALRRDELVKVNNILHAALAACKSEEATDG